MEIYYYNINEIGEQAQVSRAEQRLAAAGWNERIAASARFRMEKDRKRCLCAGLALLDALEDRGIRPSAVLKTRDGKPYLEKDPEFHFNLSHSGDYAVCAVWEREVGIDIQEIRDPEPSLLRYCCTEQEQERIRKSVFPASAFTATWSWKEAFMKMTGRGLRIRPEEIEVLLPPWTEEEIRGEMLPGSGEEAVHENTARLYGKLPLRASAAGLRPAGKEVSGDFRDIVLYEGVLGGMPVCVCGKLPGQS